LYDHCIDNDHGIDNGFAARPKRFRCCSKLTTIRRCRH